MFTVELHSPTSRAHAHTPINSRHVLKLVLPHETKYNLRARQHDRVLIPKTADLNDGDFIVCILYKSCY